MLGLVKILRSTGAAVSIHKEVLSSHYPGMFRLGSSRASLWAYTNSFPAEELVRNGVKAITGTLHGMGNGTLLYFTSAASSHR